MACTDADSPINPDNSSEHGEYSHIENFVDSLDAIFTKDGYVCLFGAERIDTLEDQINKMIYITKADFTTGTVDVSEGICIVIDSLGYPSNIAMNGYNIIISNLNNGTFDCIVTDGEKEPLRLSNLKLPQNSHGQIKSRSLASSDGIPLFGLDELIDGLGKAQALQAIINAATNQERISAGIGAIGSVLGGEAGLTLGGISDILSGSLKNSYLALAGYMWSENQKFILNHIGPWRISIESVEQTGKNTCTVGYFIEGIWDNCEGKPKVFLNCQNSDKNKHTGKVEQTLELGNAKNGYHECTIDNLKGGYYIIEMKLYDDCHRATNLAVRTYPPLLIHMFDLSIDRFNVSPDVSYSNGIVHFDIDLFLKGNEASISDVKQFGYYVKFANAIDYHQVKNLSNIFSSTPLTFDLDIERDGFFKTNYSTFTAEATDYYVGAYVVDDKGAIQHFDEQQLTGLVYDIKPSITFTSAQATGTSIIDSYEDGSIRYQTQYEFSCDVKGSFWINHLLYTISAGDVNNYWDSQYVTSDGTWTFSGLAEYTDATNYGSFFTIVLNNGSTLTSNNSLYLSCGGGGGSLTVSGSRSNSRNKVVEQRLQVGGSNYGSILIK